MPADFWSALSFSDIILLLAIPGAVLFAIGYTLLSKWAVDGLGVAIVLSGLSTVGLLFLVVWGIIYGQKIDEPYRTIVALVVFFATTGKFVMWVVERRAGHIARRERKHKTTQIKESA